MAQLERLDRMPDGTELLTITHETSGWKFWQNKTKSTRLFSWNKDSWYSQDGQRQATAKEIKICDALRDKWYREHR